MELRGIVMRWSRDSGVNKLSVQGNMADLCQGIWTEGIKHVSKGRAPEDVVWVYFSNKAQSSEEEESADSADSLDSLNMHLLSN